MDSYEAATWQRICDHPLDVEGAKLPFSDRLSRDNGWTRKFAEQVIEEYRKFCFLAVHAGHPVTPSDQVDQAWHQHLQYTYDYWERFCPDVLQTPLHHGPTAGGKQEGTKYRDWYQNTLSSYRRFFGEPPASIWPDSEARFADAAAFVRINQSQHLIVNRQSLKRWLGTGVGLAGTAALTTVVANQGGGEGSGFWSAFAGAVGLVLVVVVLFAWMRAQKANKGDANSNATGAGCGGAAGAGGIKHHSDSADTAGDGGSGCGGGCGGCGG